MVIEGKDFTLISIAGREEPDTHDELLGDTGLDGPPFEMERFGIRWNSSDSCTVQSRLETGHDSLQQVSYDFSRGKYSHEKLFSIKNNQEYFCSISFISADTHTLAENIIKQNISY